MAAWGPWWRKRRGVTPDWVMMLILLCGSSSRSRSHSYSGRTNGLGGPLITTAAAAAPPPPPPAAQPSAGEQGEEDPATTPLGPRLRPLFPLAPGFINFNHGSFGSTPLEVLSAQQQWTAQAESRPDQWFRIDYYRVIEQVRSRLASYLGVPSDKEGEVVLVENASSGVNGVLRSLPLGPGDRVLYFNTAYKMVQNTLKWLSATVGVVPEVVNVTFPVTGPDSFLQPLAAALTASSSPVKMVIFSHITSMPAVLLPAKQLASLCRQHGVTQIFVDAAHALGHIPVNITDLDVDYWVGNGHKWLYSPKGSAVLYVRKEKQEALWPQPTVISSKGDPTFAGRYSYVGTRDYTAMCAMGQALDFRLHTLGGDQHIHKYVVGLSVWAGHYLADLWGTYLLQPDDMTGAMTNVVLPTSDPQVATWLAQALYNDHDIYIVVAPLNPSMMNTTTIASNSVWFTRLSAQVYLDKDDFRKLGSLVLQLLETSGTRSRPPQPSPQGGHEEEGWLLSLWHQGDGGGASMA